MIKKIMNMVLLGIGSIAMATSHAVSFNKMIVFGDSLSDNGNLYSLTRGFIPKSPPYHEGRFSNGPVWSEQLALKYFGDIAAKQVRNYAVGGAGAVISSKGVLPYALKNELNNYFDDKPEITDKDLFVVWIGANNYLNAPTNIDSMTTDVIDGIELGLRQLIASGAKIVVIGNLPNISLSPEVRENGTENTVKQLTTIHNQKLYQLYQTLQAQHSDVKFVYFEVDKIFDDAMGNPVKYQLTNTVDACYKGGYFWGLRQGKMKLSDSALSHYMKTNTAFSDQEIAAYLNNPMLRGAIANGYVKDKASAQHLWWGKQQEQDLVCEGYFFWDHVHPTEHVHQHLMEYMAQTLKDAGVSPE